jgi:DNA-binding SARP family transcriptional activator/tetratricopeptide (TPR) repeat protein
VLPSAVVIRVQLLGQFAVEVDGRPIEASRWRRRRPVEVLAALALAPGRALHREELIDRLWPEKDLEAGANNLYRALHDLRRITGATLVTLDHGVARLAEEVELDVELFERAAGAGDLARAVELWRGDLLPDDPYSDALMSRREGLRQRFADVALRLSAQHEQAGDRDACLEVVRKLLASEPTLEPAHRLLMRVLALAGRRAEALKQWSACVTVLRERLDVAPSAETAALHRAIERGELDAPPAPPVRAEVEARLLGGAPGPIFGRAAALAQVERFVASGRGVLLVVGEAGLGKTRLAAECARRAAHDGAAVLMGMGTDLDAAVPYAPFADAWADLRRRASGASDPFRAFVASGSSAQEDRLRLFQLIERHIEELASGATLCLVIEDLHLADESSLHLFQHLSRATRALPLLLVGTLREEEVRLGTPLHTLLGSLGRERLGERAVLEPLDRDAAAALVAELAPSSSPSLVASVLELAEGNPFFIEELARAGEPRPDLLDTVRQRVHRLGRDAERLLTAAAMVGVRFPFEVARRVAALEAEPALDALEGALAGRFLAEDGSDYRFRHALTRQALHGALTRARRVHLHRAVAAALEELALDQPEALAHHHEEAGQLEAAIPYLLRAAARAQERLGLAEAVVLLQRALELMDAVDAPPGPERFRVLRMLGGMRMALADLDAAVRVLDAAAELAAPAWRPSAAERALVSRLAALVLVQGGRLDEAEERLSRAVDALAEEPDNPEKSAVLYHFAQLRWHQERYAEAYELAQASFDEASRRGDRAAMAKGHEMLALACHSLGEWKQGERHEQQRQALGPLDVDQAFDVHLCLWEYHLYADAGARAIRGAVAQTLEQAERMGAPRAVALCRCFGGTLDFQTGHWDEAEAQLRRAVELYRGIASANGEALSLQRLAVLETARGRIAEGRALIDEGLAVGARAAMRSHCLTRLHAAMARNRLAAGDVEGAQRSLDEGLAEVARHGRCATCSSLLLPEAVRVHLAREDLRAAEAYAAELEEVAARFGSRAWGAMALQARGRVLAARGRASEAFEVLERAERSFLDVGSSYEAARCGALLARLAPTVRPGDAERLAADSASVLARLGGGFEG